MERILFAREFLRHPITTASAVPSSAALSQVALRALPPAEHPVVLELGAGSGATSMAIQCHLAGRGRHIAVESNPQLAQLLRRRCPEVDVVCDDARAVVARLLRDGDSVDLVYSALPQTVTAPVRTTIFRALTPLLAPHSALAEIQHSWVRRLSTSRQVRRHLELLFEEVTTSATVWRNVPPAVVYLARRPMCARDPPQRRRCFDPRGEAVG